MTRRLLLLAATLLGLSGCVAVPVYDSGTPYGYSYGPPAATVTFGYYGAPPPPRYHHHHHHNGHRRDGYGPRYR